MEYRNAVPHSNDDNLTTYDKIRRDVLKVAKWVAIVGLGVWIIVIAANQYYG